MPRGDAWKRVPTASKPSPHTPASLAKSRCVPHSLGASASHLGSIESGLPRSHPDFPSYVQLADRRQRSWRKITFTLKTCPRGKMRNVLLQPCCPVLNSGVGVSSVSTTLTKFKYLLQLAFCRVNAER